MDTLRTRETSGARLSHLLQIDLCWSHAVDHLNEQSRERNVPPRRLMNDVTPQSPTEANGELLTLEQSVGFRLSRVARARKRAWTEELEALALTPAQASALRAVVERPDLSLRALARTMGTDPMSAKRCVDELETRELLRSTAAPGDRRPRVLNATKSGRALAREIDRRVRLQEATLREVLSAHEYEILLSVLERLEGHLEIHSPSNPVVEKSEC